MRNISRNIPANSDLQARISSYELAANMQTTRQERPSIFPTNLPTSRNSTAVIIRHQRLRYPLSDRATASSSAVCAMSRC